MICTTINHYYLRKKKHFKNVKHGISTFAISVLQKQRQANAQGWGPASLGKFQASENTKKKKKIGWPQRPDTRTYLYSAFYTHPHTLVHLHTQTHMHKINNQTNQSRPRTHTEKSLRNACTGTEELTQQFKAFAAFTEDQVQFSLLHMVACNHL